MTGRARIIARPDSRAALEAWVDASGTFAAAASSRDDVVTLEGRGRVYVVPAPVGDREWAVRHYHRGGAVASLLGDRYLRLGTPRPLREFEVGCELERRGVPTPRHVGGAVYPAGLWYRADLVTEYVPDSRDLADVLFDDGGSRFDPESAMRAAGALIRLLHERGVVHRDLNLKNLLIAVADAAADGDPDREAVGVRALVLDLDRASIVGSVSDRARRRMLDRFWRSARKWEGRTGRVLAPGLRRVFEEAYGAGA